jgi:hypothetical protein
MPALLHMLLACISIYLKSVLRYKFLILDTYHPEFYIYMNKDVRIHGYFLKPKGDHEPKRLGNTGQAGLVQNGEEQGFFEILTTLYENILFPLHLSHHNFNCSKLVHHFISR